MPHFIHEDDIYKGYLIPGGSIVIPNVWYVSAAHNPRLIVLNIYAGACYVTNKFIPILNSSILTVLSAIENSILGKETPSILSLDSGGGLCHFHE